MNPAERRDVEEDLTARHARGDFAGAGTVVMRAYGPEILGLLVAVMRDERAASDVFSQFGEDLWKGLPQFRGASSFRTWAYALAHHAAHRHRRDPLRRRGVAISDCPEVLEMEEHVRTTTLVHLRSEVKDGVRRLREKLDPEEQTLLVLRVDREMAWDEIATVVFGETCDAERAKHAASLRKRFERVKDRLRELVASDPTLSLARGRDERSAS